MHEHSFIMKAIFKKKKKSSLSLDSKWVIPMLLGVGALIGIVITWVTLFSWEQLNRQAMAERTMNAVQRSMMLR
jgi:hypothetical protein